MGANDTGQSHNPTINYSAQSDAQMHTRSSVPNVAVQSLVGATTAFGKSTSLSLYHPSHIAPSATSAIDMQDNMVSCNPSAQVHQDSMNLSQEIGISHNPNGQQYQDNTNGLWNHHGLPQHRGNYDNVPNIAGSPLGGAYDTSGNPIPFSSIQLYFPVQSTCHDLNLQKSTSAKVTGQNLKTVERDSTNQEFQEKLHGTTFAPNVAEFPLGDGTSNSGNPTPFCDSRDNLNLQGTHHLDFVQAPIPRKVDGQNLVSQPLSNQLQAPNAADKPLGHASHISGTSNPLIEVFPNKSTVAIDVPPIALQATRDGHITFGPSGTYDPKQQYTILYSTVANESRLPPEILANANGHNSGRCVIYNVAQQTGNLVPIFGSYSAPIPAGTVAPPFHLQELPLRDERQRHLAEMADQYI